MTNTESRIAEILRRANEEIAAIKAEEKIEREWEAFKAIIVNVAVDALKAYRNQLATEKTSKPSGEYTYTYDEDEDECVEDEYDEDEDELPNYVEIRKRHINYDTSLKSVRKYLKKKYGYCLAKGHQPDIEEDANTVYVSDIEWGRKLCDAEMAELN